MVKRCIFLLFFLFVPIRAFGAVYEFDNILDMQIKKYGSFNGKEGVIYASVESMEERSVLLVVNFNGGEIGVSVFDVADGEQATDSLGFPVGGDNTYNISMGVCGTDTAIILKTNNITECFIMRNDRFVRAYKKPIVKTDIAEYKKGRLQAKTQTEVFSLLKNLKNKRIRESGFLNCVNDIDRDTKNGIYNILNSAANIMSYDKNSPDIERLMKYVLYMHEDFSWVVNISPNTIGGEADIGSSRIFGVSEEYIDYIIRNIFLTEPIKPEISQLISRGYCVSDGKYYYSYDFNVDFSTEILDIVAVNDLGGGVYYVVFSDVYNRGDTKIEEYSFAVIQALEKEPYAIIRLGMGEALLSDKEISAYAPVSMRNNYFNIPFVNNKVSVKVIVGIIAALVILAIGAVILIRRKK